MREGGGIVNPGNVEGGSGSTKRKQTQYYTWSAT